MKKFLVIGNPIAHSLSPKLFTLFFKKLDLHDYLYEKFLITNIHELEMFVSRLDNDVSGFNVTSPYKVEIIKYLDYLDSSVINTNNCNCVKIINKKLYGYNTDYFGFNQEYQRDLSWIKPQRIELIKSILQYNIIPIILLHYNSIK